jgi:hypothetical protein
VTLQQPLPANLLAIADAFEPEIKRRFIDAVTEVQRWFPLGELEAAIEAGARDRLLDLISLISRERMVPELLPLADVLADIAAQVTVPDIMYGFQQSSPRIVNEIYNHGLDLVDDISDGVRDAAQRVIAHGWADGLPVPTQARILRQVVGINNQQTVSFNNYGAGLQQRGDLPPAQVEHLTEQYRRRLLTQRAETIARTEAINASMTAQLSQWREQAEVGLLQADRTKVVWKVTDDDRLCPWCAPMDGKVIDLFDEKFVSNTKGFPDGFLTAGKVPPPPTRSLKPDPFSQPRDFLGRYITRIVKGAGLTILKPNRVREVDHPPLHPSCRCTMILQFQ